MKKHLYSLVAIAALSVAPAFAQSSVSLELPLYKAKISDKTPKDPNAVSNHNPISDSETIYVDGDSADNGQSSLSKLQAIFYNDQFRHAQDPKAPYFMFMSRNGKVGMGVGGDLRVIGSYDFDGSQSGSGFAPYDIPIPKDISSNNLFQISPNRTGIFFTILGTHDKFGDFQAYVHGKFNGPNNTFKLDKAYATMGDWLFGLAPSTFSDPIAQPSTVETDGPNSEIGDSRMLFRYTHQINNKLTVAASIENADTSVPTSSDFKPHTAVIPDVAAFLQYAYAKQHVRLTGMVRNLKYTDLVSMSNHNVTGWGISLNAKLVPVDPLTIFGSVNTGRGIGSMVNDLSLGENDLLGYSSNPGKMYAPASYGWYGAVQYSFSPKVFSTLIFSQERLLLEKNTDYADNGYRYGIYATANVFWNILPRLQMGAEINVGKRCNQDGTNRMGYRTSVIAQYSF